MNLESYFKETNGTGVLSTADREGNVNAAIYARPHVIDEKTVAFIMGHRRTYQYTRYTDKAHYLFIEEGSRYQGKRLNLRRTKEVNDPKAIDEFRKSRSEATYERYKDMEASLVYYTVEGIRPLVGE